MASILFLWVLKKHVKNVKNKSSETTGSETIKYKKISSLELKTAKALDLIPSKCWINGQTEKKNISYPQNNVFFTFQKQDSPNLLHPG